MKKKKNKKKAGPQANPCGGKFTRTCCRAAIMAASYQIFSLGVGTVMDHPQLLLRREEGRTIIERVASRVSSTLNDSVYGWCLCAHLGQRGPGGGGGGPAPPTCVVCMGVVGGNNGSQGYTAPAQPPQGQQRNDSQDEEKERQALEEQRKETERRQTQEFEERKQRALQEFKGVGSGEFDLKGLAGDTGLKGLETGNDLGLKDINTDTSVVDLRDKKKPYELDLSVVKGATPQLRGQLLRNFPDTVSKRTAARDNEQAQEILRSLQTGKISYPAKSIKNLAPGNVILVAPDYLLTRGRNETASDHLYAWALSNGINWLDSKGSNNSSSPASHAAVFLGRRNGKSWYLDNTLSTGPIIKDEKTFLREYGHRDMDAATLVGQPISQREAQELWKGAHELRNNASYGIKMLQYNGSEVMVCSEASRWLLVRAGRRVPETQSDDVRIAGIDTGLNKRQFVAFSPSDFYEQEQYFIIHRLTLR